MTAPSLPAEVPMLEVVARREGPFGKGWAGESDPKSLESYIVVSDSAQGCGLGAYDKPSRMPPGMSWYVTGEIVRRVGDTFVAKVSWERAADNNSSSTPSSGTREVVLRMNERVVLDPMSMLTGKCAGTQLEAAMIMRRPTGPSSGAGVGTFGAAGAGPGVRGGIGSRAGPVAAAPTAPDVDIELWLVDTWADGSEHAVRQLVPAGGINSGVFRFSSLVEGRNGPSTLEIAGTVTPIRGPNPFVLQVRFTRRVVIGGKDERNGNSVFALTVRDRDDVVAIEPPRAPRGDEPPIPGHNFSLRLRLAPAK